MDNLEGKALEKGLEKSIDLVGDWVNSLVKPSIDVVGEMMADRMKLWRFKNQVKIIQLAQKYVEDRNFTIKPIHPKSLYQILEYSSLEDEELMQDKWASLLANSINVESKASSSQIYIQILSQLTSMEVKILEHLFHNLKLKATKKEDYIHVSKMFSSMNLEYAECVEHVYNIERLGLIEYYFDEGWVQYKAKERESEEKKDNYGIIGQYVVDEFPSKINANLYDMHSSPYDDFHIQLTDFGWSFIANCKSN